MKTGTHTDGRPIYGPAPTAALMAARAKRERWDLAAARPCLLRVPTSRGGYYVEGWAREDANYPNHFTTYTMRRDGRIGASWVALDASWVVFPAPGACEDCPSPHPTADAPCPMRRDD